MIIVFLTFIQTSMSSPCLSFFSRTELFELELNWFELELASRPYICSTPASLRDYFRRLASYKTPKSDHLQLEEITQDFPRHDRKMRGPRLFSGLKISNFQCCGPINFALSLTRVTNNIGEVLDVCQSECAGSWGDKK